MKLYIAEKPSLAKEIAKALGGGSSQTGHIKLKNGDVVTWVFGHVYEQYMPEDYSDAWKAWSHQTLPLIPSEWKLKARSSAKEQIGIIKKLLRESTSAVNAGDPDREGQLLVDELLEELRYTKTVQRIWITNLSASGINAANSSMKSNQDYQNFSNAALSRSRADWLIGINLTRAFSIKNTASGHTGKLSVGRVVTPTLRLVVDREREVRNFVSKNFYEVKALVELEEGSYEAIWSPTVKLVEGKLLDASIASNMAEKIQGQHAKVLKCETVRKKHACPNPFTLTELQAACAQKHKMTAKQVQDIAQSLYEKYKVATYPRTEVAYLSTEQFKDSERVLTAAMNIVDDINISKLDFMKKHSVFNDSKLAEHHAIIPTGEGTLEYASDNEKLVFEMIVKRYAALFYPDKQTEVLDAETQICGEKFITKATRLVEEGWAEIDPMAKKGSELPLPDIKNGAEGKCVKVERIDKKTTPPAYFDEASLIKAMKNVAKFVDDPELKALLKETSGIGTPATRGDTIEKLKDIKHIKVVKGKLRATEDGERIIDALPERITDPGMTAVWEDKLLQIEKGELTVEKFLSIQENWLNRVISSVFEGFVAVAPKPTDGQIKYAETISRKLNLTLPSNFKMDRDVCSDFIAKNKDALDKLDNPPSVKQIELATKLAATKGIKLPSEVKASMKACSAFIDKHITKKKGSSRKASPRKKRA